MIQSAPVEIAGRWAGPVMVAMTSALAVPAVLSRLTTPVEFGCPHWRPVVPAGPRHCAPVMTRRDASSTYQTCPAAGVPLRVGRTVAQAAFAGAVKLFDTCVQVVAETDTVAELVDRRVLLALYQRTDAE